METSSSLGVQLAPGVTVEQYKRWLSEDNRAEIAKMVRLRFGSRFIDPVLRDGRAQGGFAAVALICLAMQALDSFEVGQFQPETASALRRFIRGNAEFNSLVGHEQPFYDNIRNALHHRGETDGGWRIHISGPVFNPGLKIVGAQAMVDGFRAALDRYCGLVAASTGDAPIWKNLTRKMQHVLAACDDEAGRSL